MDILPAMGDTSTGEGRGVGSLLLRDAGAEREGLKAWAEVLAAREGAPWSVSGLGLAVLRAALAVAKDRGYPTPSGLFAVDIQPSPQGAPADIQGAPMAIQPPPSGPTVDIQGSPPSEASTLAAAALALTDAARSLAAMLETQRQVLPPPPVAPVAPEPPRAAEGAPCEHCGAPVTFSPCLTCGAPSTVCLCSDVLSRDGACETCTQGMKPPLAREGRRTVAPSAQPSAGDTLRARYERARAEGLTSNRAAAAALGWSETPLRRWRVGPERREVLAKYLDSLGAPA